MADQVPSERRSRVFTVRIWEEAVGDAIESRGNVREVTSGAFCNFREWSDLATFLAARMKEEPVTTDRHERVQRTARTQRWEDA